MKKLADPTKDEETALDVRPSQLLSVIAAAVSNPDLDVEKMAKLLDMHERIVAEQRKTAFMAAMSRLQAKLPQISKDGKIIVKGVERSRYARIEDIDVAIKPLMADEGFSFSFDEESTNEKTKRFSCKLSHKDGHSETKFLTVPLDVSDFRTSIQSVGSTTSYARRYLIKMHLNLIERDEDQDGADPTFITPEQVKDIETALADTHSDTKKFLELIAGVADIKEIPARDFQRIMNALETKRRVSSK